jgi:hypothetical protein
MKLMMSTSRDPLRSFPHNTIWRRLRRRWLIDRFTLFGVALACPRILCSVMWLLHGPFARRDDLIHLVIIYLPNREREKSQR